MVKEVELSDSWQRGGCSSSRDRDTGSNDPKERTVAMLPTKKSKTFFILALSNTISGDLSVFVLSVFVRFSRLCSVCLSDCLSFYRGSERARVQERERLKRPKKLKRLTVRECERLQDSRDSRGSRDSSTVFSIYTPRILMQNQLADSQIQHTPLLVLHILAALLPFSNCTATHCRPTLPPPPNRS